MGVRVGHHVVFVTAEHQIASPDSSLGSGRPQPTVVGDGTWIGRGRHDPAGIDDRRRSSGRSWQSRRRRHL